MCNKLNRLNMEENFIFFLPLKRLGDRGGREKERNLKQIRKRTHCAIRRSKFLIQFKYEKKVIESSSRKKMCANQGKN